MLASVKWLNQYLRGGAGPIGPDEADDVLTNVGFPIEGRLDLPSGDVQLDVELTSNRGDCLCHLGLAREIAASTGRSLVEPEIRDPGQLTPGSGEAASLTSVDNQISASGGCPRFTARVITGVKVGPSPGWLRERLEAVGQRSINNVVDVTNFVSLELGHPCHVFDLDTLAQRRLVIRFARPGEKLTLLDEREYELRDDEMVVADAERAVSLAGIMGGLDTSVTAKTTNVLLEMATWDPVRVRNCARRLGLRTDASHRFERYVDARDIDRASLRAAELIAGLAGGELVEGMIDEGSALLPLHQVEMRAARCEHLLGIRVETSEMVRLLETIGLGVEVRGSGPDAVLRCTIPAHRHDLTREADLIEEVARLNGFDKIGVAPSLDVHLELDHPQGWALRERAMRELSRVLTGLGFYETVTFSFVSETEARPFLPSGLRLLKVDEERRRGAPFLRPSIVPSLLTCRKANQDGQVELEGGVRLYECASVFAEIDDAEAYGRQTIENRNLAFLVDAPGKAEGRQHALRLLIGAIESVARAMGGPDTAVSIEPSDRSFAPVCEGQTLATVSLAGRHAGYIMTLTGPVLEQWDLDEAVVCAEVNLDALIDLYPPRALAHELPRYPAIRRDLSLIVDEAVAWRDIEWCIREAEPELLTGIEFVGIYRGKQIGAGKKSVTLQLEFRAEDRTLRHEGVEGPVEAIVAALAEKVGAELRAGAPA